MHTFSNNDIIMRLPLIIINKSVGYLASTTSFWKWTIFFLNQISVITPASSYCIYSSKQNNCNPTYSNDICVLKITHQDKVKNLMDANCTSRHNTKFKTFFTHICNIIQYILQIYIKSGITKTFIIYMKTDTTDPFNSASVPSWLNTA